MTLVVVVWILFLNVTIFPWNPSDIPWLKALNNDWLATGRAMFLSFGVYTEILAWNEYRFPQQCPIPIQDQGIGLAGWYKTKSGKAS